jgi:DNA-binding NarL/FixJ family response regulator
MNPIRVVLADDHPLMRTGIRNVLEKTKDIVVIGEASDGRQALELAQSLTPDVLLLDMEMPGLKGFEVAQELDAAGSPVPILVLSAHEDKQYILGVLAIGAAGYLCKDEIPDTIVRAVRGVAQGEHGWVSGRIAERIENWFQEEKIT